MKIVGTIVEYNPLHTGHIHALQEIKRQSQADLIVAVLSGNFTMRGDLSLFDKFEKTRQALKSNIDIVIELPFLYAVQNSDAFARNAIELLHLANVKEVWFGSEENASELYKSYYEKWITSEAQQQIKYLMQQGKSYKEATFSIIDLPSNDLLGFCYYKAIQEKNYPMTVHTIKRIGSFSSLEAKEFASAKAIRTNLELMKAYCPDYVNRNLIRDADQLFPYLKFTILNTSVLDLKTIFFVEEGIEHRLKGISKINSLDELISFLSTKRYTNSRIQRILVYILFQIKKNEVEELHEPKFLRVLGYSPLGKLYLNEIKKKVTLYTNIKEGLHPVLDIELKITKLLDLIYSSNTLKEEQGKPQEII